jgi:hypothetical protein
MKKILRKATAIIDSNEEHIRKNIQNDDSAVTFYGNSTRKVENAIVTMARDHREKFIMVFSLREDGIIAKFSGEQIGDEGIFARKCPLNEHNAEILRQIFPWTAPVSLRSKKTTMGCGDRLGLASPGHVAAVKEFDVYPVLAQQSIRELKLTGRTYRNVVDDTTFLVFQSGWKNGYGADGDHLKTISNINTALAAGMPMITLDLSDVMRPEAGSWGESEISAAFNEIPKADRERIISAYTKKPFPLSSGRKIKIDTAEAKRCAVMYLSAINFAGEVHQHLKDNRGDDFDLEISIDETTSPTLPEHHLFIASELIHRKIQFTSLAPRFIGEFQKAIDYIGDLKEFTAQFEVHAEIAKTFDYKISVHSGSDKFKVFPAVGKLTGMKLHLKTAGTSWLEAVRVIAKKDPVLYRVMHKCALKNIDEAKKLYHITANIAAIPDVDKIYDEDLAGLLEMNDARQLLHITYGSILNDSTIRPMFFSALHTHEEFYHETIRKHFERHLTSLGAPLRS